MLSASCIPKKAFQPNPPAFKNWVKSGSTDEDVKAKMTACGYRNLYRGDSRDTREDTATNQICMFNHGFRFNDGYKGTCYLPNWQTLPACVEYRKSH